MAAFDTFEHLINSLPMKDRESLQGVIREQRTELLAARSEDARVRLVTQYTDEIRERLRLKK